MPDDLETGCYALLLEAGDARENIPFFVAPPKGTTTADVAVLVSTYTYTVYGNHARPEWQRDPHGSRPGSIRRRPGTHTRTIPAQHPEYGLSTYNFHTDGSGIGHASWRRPMLNLRIGYITYPYRTSARRACATTRPTCI